MGGCQRRGGQEPFAPLLDALIQYLQAAGPARIRGALSGCAWLVRVLPELAGDLEPLPDGILAPEQERRLIHAAVGRLLRNLAGSAGTLLVLDDLQWAGPDALDLIHTLARAPMTPVRIVGAYRDTEVRPADPLGILLADLAQARLVRQHRLGPLTPAEAAALLADLLVDAPGAGSEHIQRVVRSAGGTPFFLVSYAQALHQGSAEGVPWTRHRRCSSAWPRCRRPGRRSWVPRRSSAAACHARSSWRWRGSRKARCWPAWKRPAGRACCWRMGTIPMSSPTT